MNTPNSPFAKGTLEQLAALARELEAPEGETFDDLQAKRKASLKQEIENIDAELNKLKGAAISREKTKRCMRIMQSVGMSPSDKAKAIQQINNDDLNATELLKSTDFSYLQRHRRRLEQHLNVM